MSIIIIGKLRYKHGCAREDLLSMLHQPTGMVGVNMSQRNSVNFRRAVASSRAVLGKEPCFGLQQIAEPASTRIRRDPISRRYVLIDNSI
jgi:hypothetical protein